jgi:hypothetical protein
MASRFSIEAVVSMLDRVSNPMGQAANSVVGFSATAQKHFKRAEKASIGFGGVVKGILGASIIQGAAYKIKEVAMNSIELASNLTEVQNVVDTTFGKGANQVNKWAQSAITGFGLSELQAKKFTGSMGAMLKSSGLSTDKLVDMSTKLVGLSGDFASFYNLDSEEAFNKIRSGISGETEPLKQLGINMSVANLQAYALTQGLSKKWTAMSQAEQVMLRYNYLLKVSKDAQGDFNKTLMTSFANQKRVLSTKFDQTLARIAVKILPKAIDLFIKLNGWIDKIDADKIGEGLKNAIDAAISFFRTFISVLKILKPFAPTILTIVTAIMLFKKYMDIASTASRIFQSAMGISKFQLLIISLMAIISLIIYLKNNWDKLSTSSKALIITIIGIASAISAVIAVQKIMMIAGWVKYILMMRGVIMKAIAATKAWAIIQKILNIIMMLNPIGLIVAAIILLVAYIVIAIKNWNKFGAAMMVMLGPIGMFIAALKNIYDRWGEIVNAFKSEGIIAGFKKLGQVILDGILYPIQQLLQLLSKIPKIGQYFQAGAEKISGIRVNALGGESKMETGAPQKTGSPGFASPVSKQIINENKTTTTKGGLDINVTGQKGIASVNQWGIMPGGIKLNNGLQP